MLFIHVLNLGPSAWRWLFAFGAVPALFTLYAMCKNQPSGNNDARPGWRAATD